MPDYLNWIGGEWIEAHDGGEFQNRNPATGETLHTFADATTADIDAAAAAARAAQPAWANTPAPRRAEVLFRAAEISVRRKERNWRVICPGNGQGDAGSPRRYPGRHRHDLLHGRGGSASGRTDRAVGIGGQVRRVGAHAGGSGGRDYTLELPIRDPDLENHARAGGGEQRGAQALRVRAEMRLEPLQDSGGAGLPPGVLNFVVGQGAEPGAALVGHAGIDLISFTGSTTVGKHVGVRCAETGKTCHLEMGGKNAIIVLADADLELAVQGVTWSAFGSSGQRCTAASRVIVERAVVEEFSRRLIDAAQQLTVGSGLEAGSDLGPIINPVQLKKVEGYMAVAEEDRRGHCMWRSGGDRARRRTRLLVCAHRVR